MSGMVTFNYFYATFWTWMTFTVIQQLWFRVLKCIYLFSLYWDWVSMFPTSGSMKLRYSNFILQKMIPTWKFNHLMLQVNGDFCMIFQPLHAVHVWCYDLPSCRRPLCLGSRLRLNELAILLRILGVSDTWP